MFINQESLDNQTLEVDIEDDEYRCLKKFNKFFFVIKGQAPKFLVSNN